jgi:hypothetical protein
VEEHLTGEGVVPRVERRKLAHQLEDVSIAGQPVELDPATGHGALEAVRGRMTRAEPPGRPGCLINARAAADLSVLGAI